jgi:hypothetical protein
MTKPKRAEASKKGKMVSHEHIVVTLRGAVKVKDFVAMADKMGVTIPDRSILNNAPNLGVLRMRAANIIRGALKRADRLDGEVFRVARAKKGKVK